MPVWMAFTDYFRLQACLLRLYEPSTQYINAGWNGWYLTLSVGVLLAISANVLLFRFKRAVGAPQALKTACSLLFLLPALVFFGRQSTIFGGGNGFFYPSFSFALVITFAFHAALFFYKNGNKPLQLS